ncbi:MAG: hypothetical protein ACHQX1_01840, partial [Candidatus Micrarchaeales archaeon]
FTLPALPSSGGLAPDLYPGQATFYQSYSQRAIVGGLDGRYNQTQLLSLYNIPLMSIAQQLEANVSPAYQSPIIENYTNQTLLSLYNYKTGFLIVDKGAFSTPALTALENYLYGVFGSPVYYDNTTIAFSTSNALGKVYESYVAYPLLTDWQQASVFLNGSSQTLWVPVNTGAVIVYAPYADQTSRIAGLYKGTASYINTTVSFYAISSGGPAQIEIAGISASGTSLVPIATMNLTANIKQYAFNTTLISGATGTTLLFLTKNGTTGTFAQGNAAFIDISFKAR